MAYPAAFSQAQLEIACGGTAALLQLADKSKTGDLSSATCQAFIVEVQAAVGGRLYSILKVAFDPADPTFQGADFVKQLAVTMGVYWAWHKSTGGIAVPDAVASANADAEKMLVETRDGGGSLGTPADPASNAGAKMVCVDRTGRRILRRNMGGYC